MSELIHTMTMEDQAALAVTINTVIEILKCSPVPFITINSDKLNRALSFSLALATATGIEFSEYSFVDGGTIHLPSLAHIVSGILTVVMQGGMQEGFYKAIKALNIIIASGKQQGLTTGSHAVVVPQSPLPEK